MATTKPVLVEVIKQFHDLKSNDIVRKIGDVFECSKSRADYLVKLELVKIIRGE